MPFSLHYLRSLSADVQKLIPSGLLDEATIAGIYRSYNVDQMITVTNNEHKVPICKVR